MTCFTNYLKGKDNRHPSNYNGIKRKMLRQKDPQIDTFGLLVTLELFALIKIKHTNRKYYA